MIKIYIDKVLFAQINDESFLALVQLYREVKIMKCLDHPNIGKLFILCNKAIDLSLIKTITMVIYK